MFLSADVAKLSCSALRRRGAGFTVIELLVVVTIMALLASALTLNLNSTRASRNVKLAQSQLVSDIRKVQSYTLSARTVQNQSVQYYLIKFDFSQPTQYTIQAVYNADSSPQYVQDVETVRLPADIRLAASQPVLISRSVNPTAQYPAACGLLGFAEPFGKVYFNDGCSPTPLPAQPYTLASSSDYYKLLTYVANTACDNNGNPPVCTVSTDSNMTITLTDTHNTVSKTVTVNGITGGVTFN